MMIRTFVATALVLGAATLTPAQARTPRQATAKLAPLSLDDSLRALPFGQPPEATATWVKERLTALNGESEDGRFKTLGALATLRRSKIAFNGKTHTLDDGVVGHEFAHANAESALVWREEAGKTHYFFFHHDRLYKYARPVAPARTFLERIQGLIAKMGRPSAVTPFETDDQRIAHVMWDQSSRTLRLTDHREAFGADLLVVESAQLARNVVIAREASSKATDAEVSDELREFLDIGGQ